MGSAQRAEQCEGVGARARRLGGRGGGRRAPEIGERVLRRRAQRGMLFLGVALRVVLAVERLVVLLQGNAEKKKNAHHALQHLLTARNVPHMVQSLVGLAQRVPHTVRIAHHVD